MAYTDLDQDFVSDSTAAGAGRFNARPSCRATTAALFAQGYVLPAPQALGPTPEASLFGAFGPTTCDGTQYTVRNQDDISGEIRLASTDSALKWSLGAYYLHINRQVVLAINEDRGLETVRQPYNPPGSANPTSLLYYDDFDTDVYAGFGSIAYDLSDSLSLSAAVRYDSEKRKVRSLVPNVLDPVTGGPINPGFSIGPILPKTRTYNQVQPKISVLFKPSRNLSVFADWGIGFKAGGFNQQGTQATIRNSFNIPLGINLEVNDEYRKETSSAFEVGFKANIPAIRMTLEGAAFYTDVDDMQFFEVFTGGFGLVRTVTNIDKVRVKGAELSGTFVLTDGWTFFASGNVTDSNIRKNTTRPNTVGNKAPYTADYTINLGTQIVAPLRDDLNVNVRADYRITGPTWFHTVQAQNIRTLVDLGVPGLGTANYAGTQREAFGVLNLRAGLSDRAWSLTVFATNLLNRQTINEVIPAPEFGGAFVAPGELRTIGVEATLKF